MSGLKVIQLLPALEAGGVERSTIEISAALTAAGHHSVVISAGGRMLPELLATGAQHIHLDIGRKSPFTVLKVRRLRQLIAGADIVHARSRLPAWLAWLAMRRLAEPPRWVNTVHGLNSPGRYSRILTRGDRVICVSESVRRHLLAHYPDLDAGRLQVIERGIDPDMFARVEAPPQACRERYRAEFPQLMDGRLLCLPGRGTRLKGHQAAIELLARLRQSGVDARLLLVGVEQQGRQRYLAQLRRVAQQRGVEPWLAVSPPRDDMQALYAASDLIMQLSDRPEAFGRTVLEALSVGRPVLGWSHGGVGELLQELFPEGAIEPSDIDALTTGAIRLLAAPSTAPVTIPYTLARMQAATLNLYVQLCQS